jgi:glycosyltransferase involved in cell wall biosynthesis
VADREDKPLRVLHLISTLDVGGAEQNLLRLLTSMPKNAFVNEVACMTAPGVMGRRMEQAGIPVHSLRMKKGSPGLGGVLRLRFMAHLYRPDIVQCWMYHANLLGLTLAQPRRTLWNIRCSDMDLSAYGPVYRYTVRAGAGLSSIPRGVVVNSSTGRIYHERLGYHPREWVVIPNGFETDSFRPDPAARSALRVALRIPDEALVIGHVGRFDPMKDHETFFRAAREFMTLYPDARFVLAGRGVDRANPGIVEILPDGNRTHRIHLLGERQDIEKVYPSFDIFTSSSRSEGFPNAVGEAMAAGVPCVATDAGDTGILMGDTGIIVPRQSPEEICRAWQTLVDMGPQVRADMGLKARERIRTCYSQDLTTRHYAELYRKIGLRRLHLTNDTPS